MGHSQQPCLICLRFSFFLSYFGLPTVILLDNCDLLCVGSWLYELNTLVFAHRFRGDIRQSQRLNHRRTNTNNFKEKNSSSISWGGNKEKRRKESTKKVWFTSINFLAFDKGFLFLSFFFPSIFFGKIPIEFFFGSIQ